VVGAPAVESGDGWVIDGLGPDGISARVLDVTRNVVRLQTGYMYHYGVPSDRQRSSVVHVAGCRRTTLR